jgi:hypothetical protein
MEPAEQRAFAPAQAGALLIVLTLTVIGVATFLGWAAGSLKGGLIAGVLLGVPIGIAGVYGRYRKALS